MRRRELDAERDPDALAEAAIDVEIALRQVPDEMPADHRAVHDGLVHIDRVRRHRLAECRQQRQRIDGTARGLGGLRRAQ